MKNLFLILSMFLQSSLVLAAAQDHQVLRDSVTAFVQQQTSALPGKTSFQVDDIDSRLVLTACEKLEAFLPTGSQLLGKVSVGVRCAEKHGWSIFVAVQIKVSLNLLVSTQQLSAGHVLQEEDISTQTIEVSQTGGLINPKQALGKVLRYSISSGQVLREDMLRAPFSVVQGQTVQLVVNGGRFTVRNSGVALNNASEGQFVKVRNQAGGVVDGLAQASGVVEIAP